MVGGLVCGYMNLNYAGVQLGVWMVGSEPVTPVGSCSGNNAESAENGENEENTIDGNMKGLGLG